MTTHITETSLPRASRHSAEVVVDPLLVIKVANALLAVPVDPIEEICSEVTITPLPRVPDHVPGLINLRGHAVPLLDLNRFLALRSEATIAAGREASSFQRVVIVFLERMRVGLLCDRVHGVIHVEQSRQQSISVTQGERLREFGRVEVVQPEGLITVLDLRRLLDAARVTR